MLRSGEETPTTELQGYYGPEEHIERLQELCVIDDTVVDIYRPQLWEIAEKTASILVDSEQIHAIRTYTGIYDWQLFGRPGDPLPPGLCFYATPSGGTLALDESIPYLTKSIVTVVGMEFSKLGMDKVAEEVSQSLDTKRDELSTAIDSWLYQSAEFQLLSSFGRLQQRPEAAPLSLYWRNVRASQIEHELRDNFGYSTTDEITAGSPISKALRTRLYQLDNELTPTKQELSAIDDGLTAARKYLLPYMTEGLNSDVDPGEHWTIVGVECDDDDDDATMYITCTNQDGLETQEILSNVANSAAAILSERLHTESEYLQQLGIYYATIAIENIYNKHTTSLDQALLDAFQEAHANALDMLTTPLYPRFHNFPDEITLMLRSPLGHKITDREPPEHNYHDYTWNNIFLNNVSMTPRRELIRKHGQVKGFVEQYGPNDYRIGTRLLMRRSCQLQETYNTEEDLTIALIDSDDSTEPFVPGYQLVRRTGSGEYGFVIDADGDPYAACDTSVGNARHELIDEYRAIGLGRLANKIMMRPWLSIDGLAKLITNNTVYYIPETEQQDPFLKRLSDFRKLVRNGKLYAQCDGSAMFFKYSLDKVLGAGSAIIISGLSVKKSDHIITAAGHAQTAFTTEGKYYIRDTTARSNALAGTTTQPSPHSKRHVTRARRNAPRLNKTPIAYSTVPPDDRHVELNTYQEKTTSQRLEEALISIREQLKVSFSLPSDKLLSKYLVKLPAHDPARKTYELVTRLKLGKMGDGQLRQQAHYIQQCAQATNSMRTRVGLGHYSEEFLAQLASTVHYVTSISKEAES
jgi:hypothetical protein